MVHALRFQVLSVPNVPMKDLLDRHLWLERLGIEVAAIADHFVDWTKPTNSWFECWTTLAAIAARTSTIRLTTGVSQIPLRHPAMLARQALTLDHISGGRFEVGLGTGLTIDPSYEIMGIENWSAGERVDRFGEYVEIVDRLLSNEVTSYSGRYYDVHDATMQPRPVQTPRPPIMIAALAPKMLRHAAGHADIWNSLSFEAALPLQLSETQRRVEMIDAVCDAIGREPTTLRRSYTLFDAQARPKGGRIAYYDSIDLFVEMVEQAVALGMSEIGLYYPMDPTQLPAFEQIATDVLPQLRRRHAAA
jgi:alkanesulfonate monooxygenase SsuD/methylene tetrahydromethanopterin reductase-like flavin-dependent oxidoreductase (luciferase family)